MYDHSQLISPGGQWRSRVKRVPFGDPVKMVVGRGLRESKAVMNRFDVRLYKGLHHLVRHLAPRSPLWGNTHKG
jgi:hypothetical protein